MTLAIPIWDAMVARFILLIWTNWHKKEYDSIISIMQAVVARLVLPYWQDFTNIKPESDEWPLMLTCRAIAEHSHAMPLPLPRCWKKQDIPPVWLENGMLPKLLCVKTNANGWHTVSSMIHSLIYVIIPSIVGLILTMEWFMEWWITLIRSV